MDKTDALNIAQKYANAVNANYEFIRIFLFGSYAKGNYNDDSDIDIAVVFKDYSNLIDMQLELMRLRRKIDSRIEPHPFREYEFELSNPIVNEIIKYGKEININIS
ncbi:MAG: nucleotidyltransferase domain-containing protein [Bacteroidales bacterium]|nr:nucleotidyltransferase domain-containing protein [Bacteroidales bacterium]